MEAEIDDKKKVDRFFRHPLTLSVIGALLGSLLIPWVAGQANKRAVLEETRIKQAVEIMTMGNSINAMLNKIATEFETFEGDSPSTIPLEDYSKRRDELQRRIYPLYADFNSVGWWWTWNTYNQARILHLISPGKLEQLANYNSTYNDNLIQTVRLLHEPWHTYLSDDQKVRQDTDKKPMMEELRKSLDDLRQKRDVLTQNMASLYQ
jgi:hypothetical protein